MGGSSPIKSVSSSPAMNLNVDNVQKEEDLYLWSWEAAVGLSTGVFIRELAERVWSLLSDIPEICSTVRWYRSIPGRSWKMYLQLGNQLFCYRLSQIIFWSIQCDIKYNLKHNKSIESDGKWRLTHSENKALSCAKELKNLFITILVRPIRRQESSTNLRWNEHNNVNVTQYWDFSISVRFCTATL